MAMRPSIPTTKAHIVRTFQALVRAGHGYDVESIVAWAIDNGWHRAELAVLRGSAQGVLDGQRFPPRDA
jgi:hypothetical protein